VRAAVRNGVIPALRKGGCRASFAGEDTAGVSGGELGITPFQSAADTRILGCGNRRVFQKER
jgi:hypothetical protein